MYVTTSTHSADHDVSYAERVANYLSVKYIPRRTNTLKKLLKIYDAEGILVVNDGIINYTSKKGPKFFFHPNLAKIRITSLMKGSNDRLIKTAQVEEGDSILDCTLGLGTDAIVFSYAVGKKGRVVALESSPIIYLLVCEGLKNYKTDIKELEDSIRRIEVKNDDHINYLRKLPSKSFDIVYFDPMFRTAGKTNALKPLRKLADSKAIRTKSIKEARRVARKAVILKEQRSSGEFERLGFQLPNKKSRSGFEYGVIRVR
ncbi:MAG: class I SAM-dependent methyltransferase [Candidatus Dojkabacteria bacterium]|nr:class I SAM-dependent methyltransferase [Candidatus Dojkabacteria bacterium]